MLLILALILLFVLPGPWDIIGATVCVVLWFGELYLWNRTVRGRRKAVGTQALVGKVGEVRTACRPLGQVFIAGELWAARCEQGADAGTNVKVTRVRGLTLEVTPVP
jgi:membrane protein implicated in regulation of membrane protease activity